ncbi:MAG: Calx-beta domain-containing protein [Pseudomonadota bacterium]
MKNKFLAFLTGGLSLVLSALTAASPPAGHDWTALREQVHASAYRFNEADGVYTINNAKQQLQARITQKAVLVTPRQADWQLGLSLSAYGYGCQLKTVAAGRTMITERGLESRHSGITEWYVNNERGLRQNFTLAQPPGQSGAELLRVVLHVNGDLSPQLAADRQVIHLNDQGGDTVVHYGGLYVYDALEQTLPAHFALADGQIVIEVDDSQAQYPITIDPLFYTEQAKLTAGNGADGDWFGEAVALDGKYALVGTPWDDDKGSVYVFKRKGSSWSEQAKLTASDGADGDWFGGAVALDGKYALVGAPWDDDNKGSVYVFKRKGKRWIEQIKLTVSDGAKGDRFGTSVALDGDTALVGAYWDDDNGYNSGSAYVFVGSGKRWNEQDKLIASDGAAGDRFGTSVALDGDTALVGAPWEGGEREGNLKTYDLGAAYVFVRSGTIWSEQDKLIASDRTSSDDFGISVALYGDTALVGSYGDGDNGDSFLSDLDIDWADIDVPLVEDNSSYSDFVTHSGSAYVFERRGTIWSETIKLTASDAAAEDYFGLSVALDEGIALVGAWMKGAAYIFDSTTWSEQAQLTASDGAENDFFGRAVALDGDTTLVGAFHDDDNGTDSGSAYVFMAQSLQFSSAIYGVNEDGGSVTLTVSRTNGSNGAVTVDYATSDDTATAESDYQATFGSLYWGDSDADDKTFTVNIVDDSENEFREIFIMSLGDASGALLGSHDTAVLTIRDNE